MRAAGRALAAAVASTAALAATLGSTAGAQTGAEQVETSQIGGSVRDAASVAQVSGRPTSPARPEQLTSEPATARGAPQLSAKGAAPQTPQLTRPGQGATTPTQAARGVRSAQGVTPLSSPQEGRTSAVARVEGRDRCDQRPGVAPQPGCEAVIETRSAEFTAPEVEPLSPEERLLSTELRQRLMDNPNDPRRVAQVLGEGDADKSKSAQGVLASLMQPPSTTSELPGAVAAAAASTQDAASQAAIAAAIAGALTGQTGLIPIIPPR